MNPQKKYLRVLNNIFSEQDWSTYTYDYISTGQYNDILIINDELIFRFPKVPEALDQLKVETRLLTSITKLLPLEIPLPLFENLDGALIGTAFMGYRKIPGQPLWRETLEIIENDSILDLLAMQLGTFLKALHSIPVSNIKFNLPRMDTYEETQDIYSRIRNKLFPYMRIDARTWVTNHFESYLNVKENFDYVPVLKHGDFGPSNILFDKQRQVITGIIDFGGSGIGDPAYDFAGLLSGYGEGFLKRCTKAYPEIDDMLERIRFYQGTFALMEALFGIENDDSQAFEDGIGMYR